MQALQAKKDKFDEWYPEIIQKAELADYSKISGCIIYRPYSYSMWEKVKDVLDKKFKELGVKNAYFPLLIPESLLKKEQEHVEGFSPEVAWVTRAGNSELDEKLAIRPTSETVMYDSYSKWIKSWRDLPLKINQWNNIIRWEFKHPRPFLRGREFLWQEGHTVFATAEEADKEIKDIIKIYSDFLKEYMALACDITRKTEKEKFAGAMYTVSTECMMPDGKMIQGPDAHMDGQNFAKAFDIKFLDKDGKPKFVWQNTWGFTTRMLGVMFAAHGDNKGLVVPPKMAPIQVVIIPIYKEKEKKKVLSEAKKLYSKLSKQFSTNFDDRDGYTPGWKFNEWELKGIPIRIEIGPKDIKKKSVVIVRRDEGKKKSIKIKSLVKIVEGELDEMQKKLYQSSKRFLNKHTKTAKSFSEFKNLVIGNRVLVAWCNDVKCEEEIKEKTGAKSVGIPVSMKVKGKCIVCNKKAEKMVYFAKSY